MEGARVMGQKLRWDGVWEGVTVHKSYNNLKRKKRAIK